MSIAFVSSDRDSKEWASYFQSMGDSWLALPYDAQEANNSLSKAFEVESIPSLVLLSSESEGRKTITTEGRDCVENGLIENCLLYTSPSPRDATLSRMPSSA